jgi:hypothetical protein
MDAVPFGMARNMRVEEDLIDQHFNSSEKRLARTLLPRAVTRGARRSHTQLFMGSRMAAAFAVLFP